MTQILRWLRKFFTSSRPRPIGELLGRPLLFPDGTIRTYALTGDGQKRLFWLSLVNTEIPPAPEADAVLDADPVFGICMQLVVSRDVERAIRELQSLLDSRDDPAMHRPTESPLTVTITPIPPKFHDADPIYP